MTVHRMGKMGVVRDTDGSIQGLWVRSLGTAHLEDPWRADLRVFCVWNDLSEDVYEKAAEGRLRVEEAPVGSGGGVLLMFQKETPLSVRPS